MSGRTIAIGDVHGCSDALQAIIEAIQPTAEDTIVTLGDYIDRGPDSPGVIDQLMDLGNRCNFQPLIGNHEAMLLMVLMEPSEMGFWMECGGRQTLNAYGGELEKIPESHIQFIRECKRFVELEDQFFVHANYTSNQPLEKQQEFVLLWEHLTAHLPAPHYSGKRAIVGHTPQRTGEALVLDHLICIDTYCYGTGWLTALDVHEMTIWQADRKGEFRV